MQAKRLAALPCALDNLLGCYFQGLDVILRGESELLDAEVLEHYTRSCRPSRRISMPFESDS